MAVTAETLAELRLQREEVAAALDKVTNQVERDWLKLIHSANAELDRVYTSGLKQSERIYRLESVLNQSAEALESLGIRHTQLAVSGSKSVIQLGVDGTGKMISSQMPSKWDDIVRPPGESVDQIINRVQDRITSEAYALSEDAAQSMRDNLVFAKAAGDGPLTAAARMLRDSVNGVFNGGLARANNIARTEMLDAHRRAAEVSQNANSDVLAGWVWWAKLDKRTCMSCIAQHGTLHELSEPGPLDHQQGKCSRLPQTKTWQELGIRGVKEPSGLEIESGNDWFKRQSAEDQRAIMGPKRFDAWKSGEFPETVWSKRVENPNWRDSFRVGSPGDKPPRRPRTPRATPPRAPKPTPTPTPPVRQPKPPVRAKPKPTPSVDVKVMPSPSAVDFEAKMFQNGFKRQTSRPVNQRAAVNPKLNQAAGYRVNCSNCVVTYEHRLRGWDVTAAPRERGRMFGDSRKAWMKDGAPPKTRSFMSYSSDNPSDMAAKIQKWAKKDLPDGARGVLSLINRNGGSHIVNWEVAHGRLVLVEAQIPGLPQANLLETYLGDATGQLKFLRLDDAEFVGNPLQFFERP